MVQKLNRYPNKVKYVFNIIIQIVIYFLNIYVIVH